jgi:hypothetical protein
MKQRRRLDWLFPVLLVLPLIGILWIFSGPGLNLLLALGAVGILSVFGLGWIILVVAARRAGRPLIWYGVAAGLTIVSFLLIAVHVPRHARWAASRPAFDQLALDIAADPHATVPGIVGWYHIDNLRFVPGGWIVYEPLGHGLSDDAGFAYLPAGPTADLGDGSWENPRFWHLGGPWYSWTASW